MKNFSVNTNGKEYWVSRSESVACFVFKEKDDNLYVLVNKSFQNHWCCPCSYAEWGKQLFTKNLLKTIK